MAVLSGKRNLLGSLDPQQRERIQLLLDVGVDVTAIAKMLERYDPSTWQLLEGLLPPKEVFEGYSRLKALKDYGQR